MKREFVVVLALLAMTACSKSESPPSAPPPAAETAQSAAKPSFINKVWAVAESPQVETGSLRVFLSDGTMVMTSSNSTPAFGTWNYDAERLTITEDGQKYDVDIVALGEDEFRIRIHNPGEPVEIRFTPAEQVAALPARAEPASAPIARADEQPVDNAAPVDVTPSVLLGTAWRLEDLAGARVLDDVQATLEFSSDGRASGKGSCNRYHGVVTLDGDTIKFGGIAATRMACAEAAMKQEDAYFAALGNAERFEVNGETLRIYLTGRTEPLKFGTAEAPAQRPVNTISLAPAAATPSLTGIWTVVAHHMPGTSAVSNDEARSRYGQTLRLTARSATSPSGRCDNPSYATSSVPTDSWLASEFKLARGSLKPLAGRRQIELMQVRCGSASWTAFGGRLLEIDANRVLAPWDGVFYELTRDRDFRAIGQEPGWQLEIRKGVEMRLTYDYAKGMAVTPAPAAHLDSGSGTRTYHAVTEANDLRVVIVPVACTDSMSGRPFPATVSVTLNGRTFRGCGEELATPYQG